MVENGRKWQAIDFHGYLVGNGFPRIIRRGHRGDQEDNDKNGRKWQKMAGNGRKWQKIDFRGYLVGNGFPRVLRHSPTTIMRSNNRMILIE